jgi:hypothetical protein
MTFATHVAAFVAVNSGLWFFNVLGDRLETAPLGELPWVPWFTGIWATGLLIHGLVVFAIARYDSPSQPQALQPGSQSSQGFQPTKKFTAKSPK